MMKQRILFLILLFPFMTSFAQESCSGELIDFESNNDFILFDTNAELWQVGSPAKVSFAHCYSGQNAIMTDIDDVYGNNLSSYFQIKSLNNWGNQTFLSFWHKWDTDTINDFGFIEYSLNGGENWYLCKDTIFYYDSTCGSEAEIFHYRENDPPYSQINNVGPFCSGSKDVWVLL